MSHHCLLIRLFRRRSKKTSKLRVTDLCAGNSPVNSPHKRSVTRKKFPIDDVIMPAQSHVHNLNFSLSLAKRLATAWYHGDSAGPGPDFYLCLCTISTKREKALHQSSHWLKSCPTKDRNQTHEWPYWHELCKILCLITAIFSRGFWLARSTTASQPEAILQNDHLITGTLTENLSASLWGLLKVHHRVV